MATSEYWAALYNEQINLEGQLSIVKQWFSTERSHINFAEITDRQIIDFMERHYVKGKGFQARMLMLYDHILSQGLCEITE